MWLPMNQVVLDLETKKSFDEVAGRNPSELGVTVVGTYFYGNEAFKIFDEADLSQLELDLSSVTRVIGFNIRRFDFPVLQPYFKRLELSNIEILDLMDELEKKLGHRVSLNSVASATLHEKKSGSGLDAIDYYRRGDMESLRKYCLDDVRLTRDIYEFGKKFGHIYYLSKDKTARLEVKVDWADPEPAQNLSLF